MNRLVYTLYVDTRVRFIGAYPIRMNYLHPIKYILYEFQTGEGGKWRRTLQIFRQCNTDKVLLYEQEISCFEEEQS